MTDVIGPGSTVGILGAGQLGRMLAMSARQMGYRVAIFGGDETSPAGQLADACFAGPFQDIAALRTFAASVDVVTYEFENIPADAAEVIAEQTPLRPGVNLLSTAQNRFEEKTALTKAGLETAGFQMVQSADELHTAVQQFGGSCILKANTQGYDGKGQWAVSPETDLLELWRGSGLTEAIVEERIAFDFELSVIAGRFPDGRIRMYDPFLNHHANHILDVTVSGSSLVTPELTARATAMAESVLKYFDVIGVLCLELFLTHDGDLLVNEIAPRPHNSGHLTIEAYNCSQFELQLRTICGLPAVPLMRRTPAAAMANLLGQHLPAAWGVDSLSAIGEPETHLHLYGKASAAENRKVGHMTVTDVNADLAERKSRRLRDSLLREQSVVADNC